MIELIEFAFYFAVGVMLMKSALQSMRDLTR